MNNDNLKIFLENLSLIHKKHEILNSVNDGFNIFSILRNESDEVNLHSRFISELFKNKKYGKVFFKLFLEEVGIQMGKIENLEIEVSLEHQFNSLSRIDILIEIKSSTARKAIVIENKIYAEDQWEQLQRYFNGMINKGYKKEEIEIVYLTLHGNSPSKESLGVILNEEDIKKISYEENIINWIEKCCKEVVLVPVIRETLIQYNQLLVKLTNKKSGEFMDDLKELLLRNKEYLKVAHTIPDVLTEIRKELQFKFWNLLENEMKRLENLYSLKKEELSNLYENNEDYSRENISKYYSNQKNNKFYGLMYLIYEDKIQKNNLYLRIEVQNNVYWGLRLINKDNDFNINVSSDYLEKILLNLKFERTQCWLGWKHLKTLNNKEINFKNFDLELIEILQDDEKAKVLVEKIVEEIEREFLELKNHF